MTNDNLENGLETLVRVIKGFDETQQVSMRKTEDGFALYFNGTDIELNHDGSLSGCGAMCFTDEEQDHVTKAIISLT